MVVVVVVMLSAIQIEEIEMSVFASVGRWLDA